MVLVAAPLLAGAQTMYDALNYSQNNYSGSARTIALGNAVTAVGGDLGTIGINPAGSATVGYSQFQITPNIAISRVGTNYSPWGETNYNAPYTINHKKMTMPNIGISMVFDTGNSSGLKSLTFAFVSNQTNNYLHYSDSYGYNSMSSKLAEFATAANGIDEELLNRYSSYTDTDISWDILTAYQGGLIGSYGAGDYPYYIGNTEVLAQREGFHFHYVPGQLNQTSFITKEGSKNDIVLNMGLNFDDVLFIGGNIGLPTLDYRYSEQFFETADNPEMFPISFEKGDTYFKGAEYAYDYAASATGIYAKIGAIYRPTDDLRIGVAFQTPTALTIDETWQDYARATFADAYFDDNGVESPLGEYTYGLRTPYEVNAGIAYTIGGRGFISVDYELTDFSVMKFKEFYDGNMFDDYEGSYYAVNETNKKFCGLQHQLRAGAELKLLPQFALRAGYTLATSPERYWHDISGNVVTADDFLAFYDDYHGTHGVYDPEYYKDRTTSYSLGFGYSSNGSFFADFAARLTQYPESVYAPYYDYDGYNAQAEYMEMVAPRIKSTRSLFDFALTLGWRF